MTATRTKKAPAKIAVAPVVMPVVDETPVRQNWDFEDKYRLVQRLIETGHNYDAIAPEFHRTAGNLKAVYTNMRKERNADGSKTWPNLPYSPKGKGRPKASSKMTDEQRKMAASIGK